MISSHEEVEKKVLAELASLQLLPTFDRPQPRAMEYDDLAKLTYTTSAIKVIFSSLEGALFRTIVPAVVMGLATLNVCESQDQEQLGEYELQLCGAPQARSGLHIHSRSKY